MTALKEIYTSTGSKFFAHTEAMQNLRNGKGQCITTHLMPTDLCQHSCAFCSVQTREGNVLPLADMMAYLDILLKYGLRAVIVSGGGNPILYKCPTTGANFNDLVAGITGRGLEIGLITNGMPTTAYSTTDSDGRVTSLRSSWKSVKPSTLDKLTWIRISMAGLDHDEREVYMPDVDPEKTTLGFSYVAHDLYDEPADQHHGKVSTPSDLITLGSSRMNLKPTWWFKDRVDDLVGQIGLYVRTYKPKYVRFLPNCLEPDMIPERCQVLQGMADRINSFVDYDPCFVQYKPPAAPNVCLLGYVHPVLNSDGFVYPCDSCVLNQEAGHKFANPWRVCHWSEIAKIYDAPVRSLIDDPKKRCPGCVFTQSNLLLEGVWRETVTIHPPTEIPEHVNFI